MKAKKKIMQALTFTRALTQQFGYSSAMIQTLILLDEEGAQSIGELASHIGVTQQAVGKSMKELRNAGRVTIEVDHADARAKSVRITSEGCELLAAIYTYVEDEL